MCMSKYNALWIYISNSLRDEIILSFEEVTNILGFEIDHSFLNSKKELNEFGYRVDKISLKLKTIKFFKNK